MPRTEAFGQTEVPIEPDEAIDPRSGSIAEKRALGLSHDEIAAIHNVSSKTVQRTLQRPEILSLVDEFQSNLYSESTAQLLGLASRAVETLSRLMESESESVALRACSKVIDMAGPLAGERAIERKIGELVSSIEARMEGWT